MVCDEVGATYHRPPMPNTHPLFIGAMADEVYYVLTTKEEDANE